MMSYFFINDTSTEASSAINFDFEKVSDLEGKPVIQDGAEACEVQYVVQKDDSCHIIASKLAVTVEDLTTWNPFIDLSCSNLFPGMKICGSSSIIAFKGNRMLKLD